MNASEQQILHRLSQLLAECAALCESLCARRATEGGSLQAAAPAAPEASALAAGAALDHLERLGVQVLRHAPITDAERGLLALASQMAKKYESIKPLLQRIKRAQSSGETITMKLASADQQQVNDITQMARLAHEAGLLPSFHYAKSPVYQLRCAAPNSPVAINFFTGEWLELYAYAALLDAAAEAGWTPDALLRAQVRLPNGDEFDLDLCFLTPAGQLVWVEAKTGNDFAQLLPKYARIAQQLALSQDHAWLLWADFDADNPMQATRALVSGMRLVPLDAFPVLLQTAIAGAAAADTAQNV